MLLQNYYVAPFDKALPILTSVTSLANDSDVTITNVMLTAECTVLNVDKGLVSQKYLYMYI